MAPKEVRKALYKDEYVTLYEDELVLSAYFFPLATDKHIRVAEIQRVYYREQACVNDFFVTKDWGMTLTPVWWARDFHRQIKHLHFNVVVDLGGDWVRKGFSVKDVAAFLNAMQQVLKPGARIEQGFPKGFKRDAAMAQQAAAMPTHGGAESKMPPAVHSLSPQPTMVESGKSTNADEYYSMYPPLPCYEDVVNTREEKGKEV